MKVTTEFPVSIRTKFIFPFPHQRSYASNNSQFIKHFSSSSSSSMRCCLSSTNNNNNSTNTTTTTATTSISSSGWVNNWKSNPNIKPPPTKRSISSGPPVTTTTAIDRIVSRLRNLGLAPPSHHHDDIIDNNNNNHSQLVTADDEKLSDLLKRDWVRPDRILIQQQQEEEESVLPWEREEEYRQQQRGGGGMGNADDGQVKKNKSMKAPTLAELTLEDSELRRLRTVGTTLRERITIPKAGITEPILQNIHDRWRKSELVRLKFHEVLARDMKTAHHIVQRRTGGLVIWQSGSVMMVYRGVNYAASSSRPQSTESPSDTLFILDVSSANSNLVTRNGDVAATSPATRTPVLAGRTVSEEEIEFNSVLDGLGPWFQEWWGTGILPVDADLLLQTVPGFKTPFRLLPTGMRSKLTNAEMTNLWKLAKSLSCHFAPGRNMNQQGLAAAIIKLWEKSMVAKIAVKRGIQNTNNELMAEELKEEVKEKRIGTLLRRNMKGLQQRCILFRNIQTTTSLSKAQWNPPSPLRFHHQQFPPLLLLNRSSSSVNLPKLKEQVEEIRMKHKVDSIGINFDSCTRGHYTYLICPLCKGGQTKERSLSFHVNQNENVAIWRCFKFECGWAGHVLVDVGPTQDEVNKLKFSKKLSEETLRLEPLGDEMIKYFAERMISADTLQKNAVMRMIDDKNVIAYTYRRKGELVNCKFRSITSRKFWQAKHGEKIFYGLDEIQEGNDIVIVEGEIDKLSMEEAGILNCVSVPDGAPQHVSTKASPSKKQDTRFKYLSDCNGYLDKAPRIILATDGDGPGQALAEELSSRLGKERCWLVTWPKKDENSCYKDANEVLMHLGAEELRQIVETAELYEVKNSL